MHHPFKFVEPPGPQALCSSKDPFAGAAYTDPYQLTQVWVLATYPWQVHAAIEIYDWVSNLWNDN